MGDRGGCMPERARGARSADGIRGTLRWRAGHQMAFEALLLVTFVCAGARCDTNPLELEFRAPPECGSADQVQSAVRTMVHAERPRLKAALEIEQLGGVYVASVGTGPGERRRLTASSCHAVMEAASVVLALAIDPHGRQRKSSAPTSTSWRAGMQGSDPL